MIEARDTVKYTAEDESRRSSLKDTFIQGILTMTNGYCLHWAKASHQLPMTHIPLNTLNITMCSALDLIYHTKSPF